MNAALRQAIERIAEGTSLRTEAEAELQGLGDYYKTAMLTPCEDEKHCTCVPALRKGSGVGCRIVQVHGDCKEKESGTVGNIDVGSV